MKLIRYLIETLRYRYLRKRGGFTLAEVTAVVAITGTLAAIVIPVAVNKIEEGRIARAALDVDAINQGIKAFFSDTGEWPDRTSATAPDGIFILRSGAPELSNTFPITDEDAAGFTGLLAQSAPDPKVGLATTWSGLVDEFVNHLTMDNPLGSTRAPNLVYRTADVNWSGPYMPQIFNDPWGRNYLVYARAFTQSSISVGITATPVYAWVISAGPNETLETDVTSPILNNNPLASTAATTIGDDVGVMTFRAREALPGVSSGGGS